MSFSIFLCHIVCVCVKESVIKTVGLYSASMANHKQTTLQLTFPSGVFMHLNVSCHYMPCTHATKQVLIHTPESSEETAC